jgi:hypothetical protein
MACDPGLNYGGVVIKLSLLLLVIVILVCSFIPEELLVGFFGLLTAIMWMPQEMVDRHAPNKGGAHPCGKLATNPTARRIQIFTL